MTSIYLWCGISTVLAYLIGAIPFGFVIVKVVAKQDIRTIGSGNIGATNVRRLLGWRYFFLVLLLDALKGTLPTWAFPALGSWALATPMPSWVAVAIGLAAILGHNFPVYLGFQGGKGVATSLGVVAVLDPLSTGLAVAGCMFSLAVTGYMSLSAILGAVMFAISRFVLIGKPSSMSNAPMTVLTVVLLLMMIVKHSRNFVRIAHGIEPKIWDKPQSGLPPAAPVLVDPSANPPKPSRSPGRALITGIVLLVLIVTLIDRAVDWISAPATLTVDGMTLTASHRVPPSQQRAERVAFADRGQALAATFPRYGVVGLYRIENEVRLIEHRRLQGRPVALRSTGERFWTLVEPMMDQRHIEPGWLEPLDAPATASTSSTSTGSASASELARTKIAIGFYPRDFVLSPDHDLAYVLIAERAEGGEGRPAPALAVVNLKSGESKRVLEFDNEKDNPARIAISKDGRLLAAALAGSNQIAWIDAQDPEHPQWINRTAIADPGEIAFGADDVLMVAGFHQGLWRLNGPKAEPTELPVSPRDPIGEMIELGEGRGWACALPNDSGLAILSPDGRMIQGALPLRGTGNLAKIRPLGVAFDRESGRIAVANQSGGSLHLIEGTKP